MGTNSPRSFAFAFDEPHFGVIMDSAHVSENWTGRTIKAR